MRTIDTVFLPSVRGLGLFASRDFEKDEVLEVPTGVMSYSSLEHINEYKERYKQIVTDHFLYRKLQEELWNFETRLKLLGQLELNESKQQRQALKKKFVHLTPAVYPVPVLINHACDPNVDIEYPEFEAMPFADAKMAIRPLSEEEKSNNEEDEGNLERASPVLIRVLKPIRKGQELLKTYVELSQVELDFTKSERGEAAREARLEIIRSSSPPMKDIPECLCASCRKQQHLPVACTVQWSKAAASN